MAILAVSHLELIHGIIHDIHLAYYSKKRGAKIRREPHGIEVTGTNLSKE